MVGKNIDKKNRRTRDKLTECQECFETLTDSNWSPSLRGETGSRPRYICKTCWTIRQRKYEEKTPIEERRQKATIRRNKAKASWTPERKEEERLRAYGNWIKRKYGITLEDYWRIFEIQLGTCAICNTSEQNGKGMFHVDHCHKSGEVRGLLCAKCNLLLGHAADDTRILESAIRYLNTHKIRDKSETDENRINFDTNKLKAERHTNAKDETR